MDQKQFFNGTNTNFLYDLDEGGDYEDILSDLRNNDNASSDMPQASNNAAVSSFSSAIFQQEQQPGIVRLTPQLPSVLVSEESIPSAGGCVENAPKDSECEPSQGTSYVPAHASGQSSSQSNECHKCELCEMSFTKPEELLKHTRNHTENGFYECKICQKRYRFKARFKQHLTAHSNERPYLCEICGRTYKHERDLFRHNARKHGEKSSPNVDRLRTCYLCKMIFANREELLSHLRNVCLRNRK